MKKQIYSNIAKAHNTTPEAVRKEIQSAMKEAMASADPHAQRLWASIPKSGDDVTPEELIDYIVNQIRKKP